MGVAGSGKSTLATLLAEQLNMAFIEADNYHSDEAVERMRQGLPLNDDLRKGWIDRLCATVTQKATNNDSMVMAYSGLKRQQRQRFNTLNCKTLFLFLDLNFEVLAARLEKREGHFFPVSLLQSQFDDLEPLQQEINECIVDADRPIDAIVADCLKHIEDFRETHA